MESHEERWDTAEVLGISDRDLGAQRLDQLLEPADGFGRRPSRAEQPPRRRQHRQGEHGEGAVHLGHPVRVEVPAGGDPPVARVGPAVGAGAGHHGAGDHGAEDQHHDHAAEPHQCPGDGRAGRPGVRQGRPVVEDDGVEEQGHAEQEVGHHEPGLEAVLHHQPAQPRLCRQPRGQAAPEPAQVPAAWLPDERAEGGDGDRGGHRPGQDPVGELDDGVEPVGGHDVPRRARRPLRAAEARPGEAYGGAGEDEPDDDERGHHGHPPVGARRDASGQETPHRHPGDGTAGLLGLSRRGGRRLADVNLPAVLGSRQQAVAAPRQRSVAGAYLALTKPRIIELLLVTTVPTMIVAAKGWPGGWLVLATLLGGSLAAGGANAINMVVDRDIDRVMRRTRGRPLVTGEVSPQEAVVFAVALEVVAFAELWWTVNLLSAVLAFSAMLFYVFVYTLWLKRTSSQNIVIGGAAGAVPTLVGWTAVTGHLALAPFVLFAVIFLWTPPHFWALAMRYRDDYAAAHVPMLPVVASFERTARQIVVYTVAVYMATLVFGAVAGMGPFYMVSAVVLGAVFVSHALRLQRDGDSARAMRLFGWSITYVTLLFGAMAVDVLVRSLVTRG